VLFEPVDFIARLAALVPKPQANLTRYYGVLTPNSHQREQVTPARRGKRASAQRAEEPWSQAERRGAMTLGAEAAAGSSDRPLDLQRVWWGGAGDRQH
jgi:hypothetical protein